MEKLTCRLKSSLLARSILHLAHLAVVANVSILAVHLTVLVLRLDLKTAIGGFVSKGVGTVVVVPVNLFKDGHRCRCLLRVLVLGQSHGRQTEDDNLDGELKIIFTFNFTRNST